VLDSVTDVANSIFTVAAFVSVHCSEGVGDWRKHGQSEGELLDFDFWLQERNASLAVTLRPNREHCLDT
jgi:hypothetical protein